MSRVRSLAAFLMLPVLLSVQAHAQTSENPDGDLDAGHIRELRITAEANESLDEETRKRILELYNAALQALDAADSFSQQVREAKLERSGIGRIIQELEEDLARPLAEPRRGLPENATLEQAEVRLARERSRLSASQSNLRGLEELAEQRANARNEASRRLGMLDQQVELLGDDLREVNQRESHPEVKEAGRYRNLALRESALREAEALRAQLDLLDSRGALLPKRIDQAQRRQDQSQALVTLLTQATTDLRRRAARDHLEQIRKQSGATAELSPALGDLAAETVDLAERLWGEQGVVAASEKTAQLIAKTRQNQVDLDRIIQLSRRQFEAYGRRGSITRWWPQIPPDFPGPGDVAKTVGKLEREEPRIQHELIRLEQLRAGARTGAAQMLESLSAEEAENAEPEVLRAAIGLLNTRRDLLDELIRLKARYSNELVELEALSRIFLTDSEHLENFLFENLIWVRSVPRPIIPRLGDLGAGLAWFFSWSNWQEVVGASYRQLRARPGAWLIALASFVLLLAVRSRLHPRMVQLQEAVAEGSMEPFPAALRAVAYTVVRAAPLPLGLFLASRALVHAETATFSFAADEAFFYTAGVAALLELTRVALGRFGLAGSHFSWPERLTTPVQRGLVRTEFVVLPLIYLALHLARAGMRLDSPAELQVYNNSLGRLAFIVGLATLGVSLLAAFQPLRRKSLPDEPGHRPLFYYAYPPILLATIIPASLAAFGYYVTGYLLAYQMLRTVWLAVLLLLVAGLLFRWRDAGRRKAADSAPGAVPQSAAETHALQSQINGLFRFVVLLVAAMGLYAIWSEAIPTLQILKRVQVWPSVTVLDQPTEDPVGIKPAPDAAAAGTGGSDLPPGLPKTDGSGSPGAQVAPGNTLTLWGLLRAVLGLVVTFMLAKNLPGLVDLILQRRSRLDSGGRIAVSTLMRYAVLILGLSTSFSLLGLSWSKIQWLAAALTFGLGFGLQEIVANFVSGLILLLERPIRVGDAVTIGDLQGQVSRIQIRATTVTLWDRSEMIVPNKEFITTKLVNWTLSDSRRRLDIPLRIAYGADLVQVKETLVGVATVHPDVFEDPPPRALVLDFGNDAIRVELRVFVDFGKGLTTRDELSMGIDRAFRERGIAFALPQLNLQIPHRTRSSPPKPAPPEPTT